MEKGPFAAAGPDPKLRAIIALYPEAFTVVARADTRIRDFQDLRDRRVGSGTSGVGYNFTREPDGVLGAGSSYPGRGPDARARTGAAASGRGSIGYHEGR